MDSNGAISQPSLRRAVLVTDPQGVHARAAVAIAALVHRSGAKVTLRKGDQQAAATEVLQIMSLAADRGDVLEVEVSGNHAPEVIEAIERFLAGDFDKAAKSSAEHQ